MTLEPPGSAEGTSQADELLVGDLYLTRTFRLASDGLLYPVFSTTAWSNGTLTATCKKGHTHTAPETDCTCGFYAYSDPAYLGEQPPWRHVIAVVAFTGTVEISTRGARAQHARLVAVWLGPRITADLQAQLSGHYPSVPVYRDCDLMFAQHPLTATPVFSPPRHDTRARTRGRRVLAGYTVAAFIGGVTPPVIGLTSPLAGAVWTALLLGAIAVLRISRFDHSPTVAMTGLLSLFWLIPSFAPDAGLAHTDALLAGLSSVAVWQSRARPGQTPPHLRHRFQPRPDPPR